MRPGDGLIDSQQLPCGCTMQRVIEDGQRVLKIEACDLGLECANLANALGMAQDAGKPTEIRGAS